MNYPDSETVAPGKYLLMSALVEKCQGRNILSKSHITNS